jgi:pSer/pThr/pTyr-binding forkhead associated (FHA) protein
VISDLGQVQDTGRLSRLTDRERRRAATADPAPTAGRYLAVDSGGEELHIPVDGAVTRLGRGISSDVNLEDPTVSRRHALIVQRGADATLLDDRSMNGTWLNGERIREAPLSDGDVIQLGAVRLRYLDVQASQP